MGLGPMVCVECLVYAELTQAEHQDGYGPREWVCPCCGTTAVDYLFMFTEEEQNTIATNSRFVRFVEGRE